MEDHLIFFRLSTREDKEVAGREIGLPLRTRPTRALLLSSADPCRESAFK